MILLDFEKYTFDGLLSSEPRVNGNMLSATAQAYAVLMSEGSSEAYIRANQYKAAIFECLVPGTGIFKRRKDLDQDTAIDDYLCIAAIPAVAQTLYYKAHPFYYLNLEKQGFKYVFKRVLGRHLGLIPHISYGAFIRPNILLRFIWGAALIASSFNKPTNQDAWLQSWMMVWTYRRSGERTFFCDLATKIWWKMMNKKAINMGILYAQYCQIPDHPLAKYWPQNPLV